MSHTPRPWFVDAEWIPEALCRIRSEETGDAIADVFALDRGYDNPDHEQLEATANARLIAAAPDLLAICELLKQQEEFRQGKRRRGWDLKFLHDELNAAIAKAKGQS